MKSERKERRKHYRTIFPYRITFERGNRPPKVQVRQWLKNKKLKPYDISGEFADYWAEKGYTVIRFRDKDKAMLFKLSFRGCK